MSMPFQESIAKKQVRKNTMWLTSLADLLALLLAFFVLLFSMNEVKSDSWQDILNTLGYRLNTQTEATDDGLTAEKNVELFTEQKAFDLDYLENIISEKIRSSTELNNVEVFKSEDRLVLSFIGNTYFPSGVNEVSPKLEDGVRILGESFRYVKNRVEVYGHTDPTQALNPQTLLDNNWGLSLARALAVADNLTKAGYSFPVRAYGMADSKYHELSDIQDKETRLSYARRVDIVIREAQGRRGGNK
ncbi:flagellar motor protein MotB [Sneathiella sp.]|jgi:chemotaxis protein MotB|uniref:OmpA/MotB family protein n=1 Tax=Sneathiella sp. TaxID=1964365 RepID=UPI0039E3C1C4